MAMTRCKADLHFYDMEKHNACPYCQRLKGDKRPVQGAVEKGEPGDACSAPTILMDSEKLKSITAQVLPEDHRTAAELPKESAPAESVAEQSAPTELFTAEPSPNLKQVTVMFLGENKTSNPVVGWLVCTEGTEKGRDYRITDGMNEIGRDPDSEVDIVIKGDNSISKRYHAEIQYDREENVFYLIRMKNEAVKVNDVKVRRPTRLGPYDIVQLGETKFVFVPLCSEKFQWATGP